MERGVLFVFNNKLKGENFTQPEHQFVCVKKRTLSAQKGKHLGDHVVMDVDVVDVVDVVVDGGGQEEREGRRYVVVARYRLGWR